MKPQIFVIKKENPLAPETAQFLMQFAGEKKRERILSAQEVGVSDNMLLGAALTCAAVKMVFGVDMRQCTVEYGAHGKPYIKEAPHIHFNISHSGDVVAVAVCDTPVGIDVQKIVPYNEKTARRVCSAAELDEIQRSFDKASEFIKLWTKKEAVLKKDGVGITLSALPGADVQKIESQKIYKQYWLSIAY